MNDEDLAQYIYVTQDDYMISKICNIDSFLIDILSLEQLKELVLQRVSTSDRLSIYYKLNNLYPLHEDEMANFVDYAHYHLAEVSEINYETLVKVKYILVETVKDMYGY